MIYDFEFQLSKYKYDLFALLIKPSVKDDSNHFT